MLLIQQPGKQHIYTAFLLNALLISQRVIYERRPHGREGVISKVDKCGHGERVFNLQ